jgi:TonB-linked SusC/RagA family outer membrane protein
MSKTILMWFCLVMASITTVQAQSVTASGRVVSAEDGQPVIGATVLLKGTTNGVLTDSNGRFIIPLTNTNRTLVISYVGMKTVEVEGFSNMIVKLESKASELDEVIVVAYGTAKKSAFTGSAVTVNNEKIAQRQFADVTYALSGQVPGVQVISSNGQPGTSPSIRIRGIGSMSASNSPLYVVDGVPYDGSISAINPNDIETMTVLKDAAASAIYGARGANGVIIITTRKGKLGEPRITVDARWGQNSRGVPQYEVMKDPAMYYETFYRALYNSKRYAGATETASHEYARNTLLDKSKGGLGYQVYTVPEGEYFIGTNFKLNPHATLGYSDQDYYYIPDNWFNELFDRGNLRQEYNASLSGSSDKVNYFFSVSYLDDSGIIHGSGFSRFTSRSNVDYQPREWLKVGANMSYTYYDLKAPDYQTEWGSSGNVFYVSDMIAPIYPMYVRNASDKRIKVDKNGYTVYDFGTTTNQVRAFMGLSNPAIELLLNQHDSYHDVVSNKWFATADLLEGLQVTANIGLNVSNEHSDDLYNPFYGASISDEGQVAVAHERDFSLNQQYLATYKKDIDLHHWDLLAGYESYRLTLQQLEASSKHLYNPLIPEIGNAIYSPPTVTSSTDSYATMGWLGRIQYDYGERFFASASYRRDDSSRFHPDRRWGNFGSLGGAWLLSKESFFESWINPGSTC